MPATHVVLVHPEIHWNTGNAGRTCLATGATLHLIEPLGFSLGEREVKRAGLDYWEHVDVRVWRDWETFEKELPTLGTPFFFSTKATRVFWDAPLATERDVVLIFGRETGGLPADLTSDTLINSSRCPCCRHWCVRSICRRAWRWRCSRC